MILSDPSMVKSWLVNWKKRFRILEIKKDPISRHKSMQINVIDAKHQWSTAVLNTGYQVLFSLYAVSYF